MNVGDLAGLPLDQRLRRGSTRGLLPLLLFSLVAHAGAIGVAIVAQRHRPSLSPLSAAIPVQLVKLGKRRDPNLLPRKVEPPPAQATEPTAIALDTRKTEDTETPPPSPKSKAPELSKAAKRLLANADTRLDDALGKLEDQEGDPDGDVHGTTTDNTNAAAGYQRKIMSVLQSSYRLPETIPASQRPFLKARVVLFIERNGRIARYEFLETHPNGIFMSALEALLKSIALPPPPKTEQRAFREQGVEVIFRP